MNKKRVGIVYYSGTGGTAKAAEAVYKWIESRSKVNGIPVAVISVSGGGEVSPNTACRLSTIKRLESKGYLWSGVRKYLLEVDR